MTASADPVIATAVHKVDLFNDEDVALARWRDRQLIEEIAETTRRNEAIREGEAKGKAEGLAEGLAEGAARAKAELIRMMLAKGQTVSSISDITGLTVADIETIASTDVNGQ